MSMSWSHLTHTQQRLESMSELKKEMMSHDKCRWRRVMSMLMNICEYDIWLQTSSSWVKSRYDFDVAVKEEFRSVWEDVVSESVSVSDGERSLEIIDSWVDEWRIKVLDEENDIATIRSSNREDDSNECESEFIKSEETETFEKIERLDLMLSRTSDNCFWVCVKSRVTTDFETDDITWVIFDEDQ